MSSPEWCDHDKSSVYDSRTNESGVIRRRRECKECGWRWGTVEHSSPGSIDELVGLRKKLKQVRKFMQYLESDDNATGGCSLQLGGKE